VEILFPVEDPDIIRRLRHEILETYLRDNVKARVMLPDGTYERAPRAPEALAVDSQEWFILNGSQQGGRIW
jgi:polyphosphate kinase